MVSVSGKFKPSALAYTQHGSGKKNYPPSIERMGERSPTPLGYISCKFFHSLYVSAPEQTEEPFAFFGLWVAKCGGKVDFNSLLLELDFPSTDSTEGAAEILHV